jgi:hypothetical protein
MELVVRETFQAYTLSSLALLAIKTSIHPVPTFYGIDLLFTYRLKVPLNYTLGIVSHSFYAIKYTH